MGAINCVQMWCTDGMWLQCLGNITVYLPHIIMWHPRGFHQCYANLSHYSAPHLACSQFQFLTMLKAAHFKTVYNRIFRFQQQHTPQNVSHLLFFCSVTIKYKCVNNAIPYSPLPNRGLLKYSTQKVPCFKNTDLTHPLLDPHSFSRVTTNSAHIVAVLG